MLTALNNCLCCLGQHPGFEVDKSETSHIKDRRIKLCHCIWKGMPINYSFPLEFLKCSPYCLLIVIAVEKPMRTKRKQELKTIVWFKRATGTVRILLWLTTGRLIYNAFKKNKKKKEGERALSCLRYTKDWKQGSKMQYEAASLYLVYDFRFSSFLMNFCKVFILLPNNYFNNST